MAFSSVHAFICKKTTYRNLIQINPNILTLMTIPEKDRNDGNVLYRIAWSLLRPRSAWAPNSVDHRLCISYVQNTGSEKST